MRESRLFRLLHDRGVDLIEEVLVVEMRFLLAEGLLGGHVRGEHERGSTLVHVVGLLIVSLGKELVEILVAHFEG